MAKRRGVAKANAPHQLLKTLTDSAALPAFVRQLPAPVLKRLVDYVGVRDAGELVALTTTTQLRELFEESLWENLTPGKSETLQSGRFVEWLDVLLETGVAAAAERLVELGETFVVLQLEALIKVIAMSTAVTHRAALPCSCSFCVLIEQGELAAVFDDYLVSPLHDDEWEPIHILLVELDGANPDFLARVLARCCHEATVLGFADDGAAFLADQTYEREQRREAKGFVTPVIAASFLAAARGASLDELCAQTAYDALTEACLNRTGAPSGTAAGVVPDDDRSKAEEEGSGPPPPAAELRELEAALIAAELVGEPHQLRLTAPQRQHTTSGELQSLLDRLQLMDPHAFSQRLNEVVFLANVLMAGSWYQGGRFTQHEAAQAALACANLGMEYMLTYAQRDQPRDVVINGSLETVPGVVRLFQVGWQVLQRLPRHAGEQLLAALRRPSVREQLARKRWMLDEIESAVSDPDLLELIEKGEFEDVSDNLVLLSLVLDPRACHCLRTLMTDFPRYPAQLNVGIRPGQSAVNTTGFIAALRDLDRVEEFLTRLDEWVRV